MKWRFDLDTDEYLDEDFADEQRGFIKRDKRRRSYNELHGDTRRHDRHSRENKQRSRTGQH
jgi:hypothetical protein